MPGASGSAKCSPPAKSVAIVSAVLWLPDDLNARAASLVENEEDPAQASSLQRCLQSLQRQTLGASGIAQQMLLSEFSLLEDAFSQHSIDFIEGVDKRNARDWRSVKAFTCLQVRVLGGVNPQMKRRSSRKLHVAIIYAFVRPPVTL